MCSVNESNVKSNIILPSEFSVRTLNGNGKRAKRKNKCNGQSEMRIRVWKGTQTNITLSTQDDIKSAPKIAVKREDIKLKWGKGRTSVGGEEKVMCAKEQRINMKPLPRWSFSIQHISIKPNGREWKRKKRTRGGRWVEKAFGVETA